MYVVLYTGEVWEYNIFYCSHRHAADHQCGKEPDKPGYMSATAQHVQSLIGKITPFMLHTRVVCIILIQIK